MTRIAPSNVALLDNAIAEIHEVTKSLTTTQSICPCCGMTKYDDWDDAQAYDQLTGVINRLTRLRNSKKEVQTT